MKNTQYRAYKSWGCMKTRCNNPKYSGYKNYGGKGITYDPKWDTFQGFLEDMGERPEGDYVIDRIDVNGNYCKNNCRWVTRSENSTKDKITHGLSKSREYINQKAKEYYYKDLGSSRQKAKEAYYNDIDTSRLYKKEYYLKNRDKISEYNKNRRKNLLISSIECANIKL